MHTPNNRMDLKKINSEKQKDIIRYINLQLSAMGQPTYTDSSEYGIQLSDPKFIELTRNLVLNYQAKKKLVPDHLCPADKRIQTFINSYLSDIDEEKPLVPTSTFVLDQEGLARELSLAPDSNEYSNEFLKSYRIKQGVLHNPKHDRRTTKGSFHIVEGGLPVPIDKIEVPKIAFNRFLKAAFNAPKETTGLPFTSTQEEQTDLYVSLFMRPIVCPEVKGIISQKSLEIRYFAPAAFVSNTDFVESIFGNAGDPTIATNDAGLDIEHWTGHTGCIVLAPHILTIKKKDLGLPHYDDATERQRRDGVCWKNEDELYNDGQPFKLTCRDDRGVVITIIADNYFGYSKKEVKTQISYSANLYGLTEEEHAGGAIAFQRKNIGIVFDGTAFMDKIIKDQYSFKETVALNSNLMDIQEEGHGIDKEFNDIIYIPEDTKIDLYASTVKWQKDGKEQCIKLLPYQYYVHPSGYKIHMEKHPSAPSWRLVSTYAEGTFCHKPCTVSGGGKSEISKSLLNAIIYSSFYINNMEEDFKIADEIINYDYSNRWNEHQGRIEESRTLLNEERSLGSVVKLLTPSKYYTKEYNSYLASIPDHVKALVLYVKRFYRPLKSECNWKEYFSVDVVNGHNGKELLFDNRKLIASYLRIGFAKNNSWYLHKLRADFIAAAKIQMEDDITASIVLPARRFKHLNKAYKNESIKITANCERRFFQRPDEAINRGYDKEAEADLSMRNNFTSNYEPLSSEDGLNLVEDAIGFDKYTKPIQKLIKEGTEDIDGRYFITPSHPRMVDGAPSKNPRYLQIRPDLVNPVDDRLAEVGIRLSRKMPMDEPVVHPVNAVLAGRRNNPADKEAGIRALSVYNPIHYQELPELFMDFICSLTGKSPSTTGAGSEGALTKGPFNMLSPTSDLNNTLLSHILTGYNGFTSAAGYVGSDSRFDHDISLLVPELWCRLKETDRNPENLIKENSLEKLEDFVYEGQTIKASRLGYRITDNFLFRYMNRIFDEPQAIFTENMLKPELQDLDAYADGVNNIIEAQEKVAKNYFADGSIDAATPPLRILLNIMAYGEYEGKDISNPELRKFFTREYVLNSDWYKARLVRKQQIDINFQKNQIEYINTFINNPLNDNTVEQLQLNEKIKDAKIQLEYFESEEYLNDLVGTIGADPLYR
ncbi:MAG: hypothetical protein WBG43_08830 [Marinifilaceae bacterium]